MLDTSAETRALRRFAFSDRLGATLHPSRPTWGAIPTLSMVCSTVSRLRAVLPLLLCFAWVTSGCDSSTPAPAAPAFDASALSGEDLFSGLVLGDGPAAFAVPELWGAHDARGAAVARAARTGDDPEVAAALAGFRQSLVEHVAEADPAFFDRFKAEVTSGSPLRVQRALRETAALIASESTTSRLQTDGEAVVEAIHDMDRMCLDVGLDVDISLQIERNAFILVQHALDNQTILDADMNLQQDVATVAFYLPPTLPSEDTAEVSAERVAALIAERLYTPGR